MQLQALRPKCGADLAQLRDLLDGKGWQSALPPALPDTVLLRLARDFRILEADFTPDRVATEEDGSSMAAAIYVVMNLLIEHPGRLGAKNELQLSDAALFRALQVYQIGLEREIVTRITGLASSTDAETLAKEIVRCTDERLG
jgi:hypothetical protein